MDQSTSSDLQTTIDDRWHRFLLATVPFIAFETFLIAVFGKYFFTGVSSELGVWLMFALAAVGYFGLGLFSGSWLSLLVIWVPLVIVIAIDPAIPAHAWGGSERLPLYGMWFYASVFFLPAWLIGALLSGVAHKREP